MEPGDVQEAPPAQAGLVQATDGSRGAVAESVPEGLAATAVPEGEPPVRRAGITMPRAGDGPGRVFLCAPDDLALLLDPDGTILEANEGAARRLGLPVTDLAGRRAWDLVPSDQGVRWRSHLAEGVRTAAPVQFEDENAGRWFNNTFYPILDGAGQATQVAVFARDITDRKQLEQALRDSGATARDLFNALTDLALYVDAKGTVLEANDKFLSLMGTSREAVIGQLVWDLFPPEVADYRRAALEEALRSWKPVRLEEERRGRWFDTVVSPVGTAKREHARFTIVARDITKRKRAETDLRESEARYRTLFEDSPIALWEEDLAEVKGELDRLQAAGVHDLRAYLKENLDVLRELSAKIRVIDVNQAAVALYRAQSKEQLSTELYTMLTEKGYRDLAQVLDAVARGAIRLELESLARISDGEERLVMFRWTVAPGYEHSLARALVSVEDITSRKQAEQALRKSEERYRTLFEESPVALLEEDYSEVKQELERLRAAGVEDLRVYFAAHPDAARAMVHLVRVIDANRAALALYGARDKQELLQGLTAILSERGYEVFVDVAVAIAAGAIRYRADSIAHTLSGEDRPMIFGWTAASGFEQSLARILISIEDITERKRLEQALLDSLEQTERSRRLVLALGEAAQAVQRARAPEEIFQTIGRELIGLGLQGVILTQDAASGRFCVSHTTWAPASRQAVEALTGSPVVGYQFSHDLDNLLQHMVASGHALLLADPLGYVEQMLPEPAKSLATRALQVVDMPVVVCAPMGTGSETRGLLAVAGSKLTQADVDAVSAFANQTVVALDNVRLYQQIRAAAAELEDRVQERTAELAASEVRYRTLFDSNQDGLLVFDREGRFLDANPAAGSILGYSPEDLRNLDLSRVAGQAHSRPEELGSGAPGDWWQAMQQGAWGNRTVAIHREGHAVPVELTMTPVTYSEQDAVLAVIRDITAQQQAEQALHRSREQAIRGQRLLLALGQAAESVQRARTREQVFETIGTEVSRLGYTIVVMLQAEDSDHVAIRFATWQSAALRAAERLAGLTGMGLRVPLAPDGLLRRILTTRQGAFHSNTVDLALKGFPSLGRTLLERLVGMLGIERGIYAPLVVGGEVEGLLAVMGGTLTEDDLPAVMVFANQASIALENVRLVEELSAGREQMQALAHQVVTVLEEERRRLSRALHDEAGQALTALKISLELAAEDLPPQQADVCKRVRSAANLAGETMDRIRRLAQDLRPPALDAVGLGHTLQGLCQDFGQRTRLEIEYHGQDLPPLPEAVSIALYRFLQEALTNVAKHAGTRRVRVELNHDAEAVRLQVRDDGRGFDPREEPWTSSSTAGMGLLGMRERLNALGGWLEVLSEPGKGTCVVAYVPLEEE